MVATLSVVITSHVVLKSYNVGKHEQQAESVVSCILVITWTQLKQPTAEDWEDRFFL